MKYTIDYEYGQATLYTPSSDWEDRFFSLANQCFGIRKSIGETTLISSADEPLPEPWSRFTGAHEMLMHSGDTIIWNADGEKILSEWD